MPHGDVPHGDVRTLRDWLDDTADDCARHLFGRTAQVALAELAHGSSLDIDLSKLQGRSVLIATREQLTAALALIELDGVARRLVLVPPDVPRAQLATVIADAGIDALVCDDATSDDLGIALRVTCRPRIEPVTTCAARSAADRMGAVHLRHHRRTENGGAQPGRIERRDQAQRQPRRHRGVGHVL